MAWDRDTFVGSTGTRVADLRVLLMATAETRALLSGSNVTNTEALTATVTLDPLDQAAARRPNDPQAKRIFAALDRTVSLLEGPIGAMPDNVQTSDGDPPGQSSA